MMEKTKLILACFLLLQTPGDVSGQSTNEQSAGVQHKELEESGFREARALWFSLSSSNERQCRGSVRRIHPGESITIQSHEDYGLADYPSDYQCRWLVVPDRCTSLRVSCKIHTTKKRGRRCDYHSDYLRMIGYKGAFSNYFCGPKKNIHINLNGRDALMLMFYSHSKFADPSVDVSTRGFSCQIVCRSPFAMEEDKMITTTAPPTTTTTAATSTATTSSTNTTDDPSLFFPSTALPVDGALDPVTTTDKSEEGTESPFGESCECGIYGKPSEGRIVCPSNQNCTADPFAHPWQAALVWKRQGKNSEPWCGGSVINDRYILTAAHCISRKTADRILVVLGQHDWRDATENSSAYTVEKIIKHQLFDSRARFDYDYALLRLSRRINFDKEGRISPICLPKAFHPQMISGAVSGWGVMDPNNPSIQASELQEVSVDHVDFDHCQSAYGKSAMTDTMFCAAAPEADACFGDSGGPLAVNYFGRTYLEGIVSWGRSCASPLYPGVYASVRNVTSWIEENTWDSVYCTGSPRSSRSL